MYYKIMAKMHMLAIDFRKDNRGVTAVEYAIIAVVMSALVLAAFQNDTLRNAVTGAITKVTENLTTATGSTTGS